MNLVVISSEKNLEVFLLNYNVQLQPKLLDRLMNSAVTCFEDKIIQEILTKILRKQRLVYIWTQNKFFQICMKSTQEDVSVMLNTSARFLKLSRIIILST